MIIKSLICKKILYPILTHLTISIIIIWQFTIAESIIKLNYLRHRQFIFNVMTFTMQFQVNHVCTSLARSIFQLCSCTERYTIIYTS